MLIRYLSLLCAACLMVSCTSSLDKRANDLSHAKPQVPTTTERPVSDFQQVYVHGPFNVRLHTHRHQKASLKIESYPSDLKHIYSYVKDGVLYVSDGKEKARIGRRQFLMQHPTLDINIPEFHGLTYKGEGDIEAHRIRSSLLDLWIMNDKKAVFDGRMNLRHLTLIGQGCTKITGIRSRELSIKLEGAPKVELKGDANLKRVEMDGRGVLDLYWVKSHDLIVRLNGSSQLKLAGKVNRLDGVFSGHSHFSGQYLRVKEAFVKTHDEATADMVAVENQHALATHKSDIYYHNLPPTKTDFMAQNGSILDMRPEALKEEQKYTIYNH